MAPIFDMGNHRDQCPFELRGYDETSMLHYITINGVEPGDEVSYRWRREQPAVQLRRCFLNLFVLLWGGICCSEARHFL